MIANAKKESHVMTGNILKQTSNCILFTDSVSTTDSEASESANSSRSHISVAILIKN